MVSHFSSGVIVRCSLINLKINPFSKHSIIYPMSPYKETEGIKMHCSFPNRICRKKRVDRKANKISSYAEQAKQDCT